MFPNGSIGVNLFIGKCPYNGCDETMWNAIADTVPCFQKTKCEKCSRVVWLYHSRIEPVAYTVEGFLERFAIDEETKVITPRDE